MWRGHIGRRCNTTSKPQAICIKNSYRTVTESSIYQETITGVYRTWNGCRKDISRRPLHYTGDKVSWKSVAPENKSNRQADIKSADKNEFNETVHLKVRPMPFFHWSNYIVSLQKIKLLQQAMIHFTNIRKTRSVAINAIENYTEQIYCKNLIKCILQHYMSYGTCELISHMVVNHSFIVINHSQNILQDNSKSQLPKFLQVQAVKKKVWFTKDWSNHCFPAENFHPLTCSEDLYWNAREDGGKKKSYRR